MGSIACKNRGATSISILRELQQAKIAGERDCRRNRGLG